MKLITAVLMSGALLTALVGCATPKLPEGGSMAAAAPAGAASAAMASNDPPATPMPAADCLAVLDRLSQGIPRNETGPVLRSQGLRIKSPIRLPEGVITDTSVPSAARVRVLIDNKGSVIPGSVVVQQATGDPKLPLAMSEAVPASLSFDVSGAFSLPKEFAFTTVYVTCAKR